ncbi:unnamed protein product [Rotaria sp. Silwood2]|nr:unnamed protein product [Rotaria sp. Silwood2]CAF2754837.1 unnamed protein product [Rotaria sp. Silwood2]CAF3044320.1 unnamed protein product [Rotaria sp. Silwood2]CAF3904927.1 unnamed protein product [Rotaria sp. Silwood2]CAF3937267.1 unnamed protein product [Rotaria sp. Silwood2]
MTSLDFNFAEPIASYDDSADTNMDTSPQDIGSIQKSDFVVLNGRPLKVVEVTHSKPGKHGHAKVHLVGIDIYTGRRYEDVRPAGHIIQVPKVGKKDYLVVSIDKDGYVTLLNEDTCNIRSDMKINKDSDMARRLLDKFRKGDGQIKVTVLKALDEEQIMAFKVID